jgi:hypothetical protein
MILHVDSDASILAKEGQIARWRIFFLDDEKASEAICLHQTEPSTLKTDIAQRYVFRR